jgi:hypothetical protein
MTKLARFTVKRDYALNADEHFAQIVRFDELADAMQGQVRYVGLPDGEAFEGQSFDLKLFLWGWIPIGGWHIDVVERSDETRVLRSVEHGGVVKSMRHTLTVTPTPGGGCTHTDSIEVEAGWFTRNFARTAQSMYEKRHDMRAKLRG